MLVSIIGPSWFHNAIPLPSTVGGTWRLCRVFLLYRRVLVASICSKPVGEIYTSPRWTNSSWNKMLQPPGDWRRVEASDSWHRRILPPVVVGVQVASVVIVVQWEWYPLLPVDEDPRPQPLEAPRTNRFCTTNIYEVTNRMVMFRLPPLYRACENPRV